MAVILILAGLIPGLVAMGLALGSGAGFLVILGAYMGAGLLGMLLAAAALVHKTSSEAKACLTQARAS